MTFTLRTWPLTCSPSVQPFTVDLTHCKHSHCDTPQCHMVRFQLSSGRHYTQSHRLKSPIQCHYNVSCIPSQVNTTGITHHTLYQALRYPRGAFPCLYWDMKTIYREQWLSTLKINHPGVLKTTSTQASHLWRGA